MKKIKFSVFCLVLMVLTGVKLAFAERSLKPDEVKFEFIVERTPKGVILRDAKGTAWIKTQFTLKVGESRRINQWGMADKNGVATKDGELANFSLIIKRTKNGFEYLGESGTDWKSLSFKSDKYAASHKISASGVESN